MNEYIDNLVSLKTENMMGPRLSTHNAMAQVLNQHAVVDCETAARATGRTKCVFTSDS